MQDNLRITELNYNPYAPTATEVSAGYTDANAFEFIELVNTSTTKTLDLHGVQFTAGVTFSFSAGNITSMAPGDRIVVVKNLAAFQARSGPRYGSPACTRVASVIRARKSNWSTASARPSWTSVTAPAAAWPGRADGKGSSLEVINPAGDYNDPNNWRSSAEYGGSPGQAGVGPMADVVINEVLTHTDQPEVDSIELYNPTAGSINVGGWYLSDSNSDYLKFRIPDSTQIAAHGYLVFYQGHWVGSVMQFASNEFGGGARASAWMPTMATTCT